MVENESSRSSPTWLVYLFIRTKCLFLCFHFTDILKGASSNAMMHIGSTSCPSMPASSELSEGGVEVVSSTPISVPSVSDDSSRSVATEINITGKYPFNPNAIVVKPRSQQETHEGSSGVTEVTTFSPDLVKKYEKRFENGYNVYTDEKYIQWLRMNHPGHLPSG